MRRLVLLAVGVALVPVACGSDAPSEARARSPRASDAQPIDAEWKPKSTYERLLAQVEPSGQFSKDTALQLFVLQFGSLPDVPEPERVGPTDPSGTLAINGVLAVWGELTEAQRTAVRERLELPAGWQPDGAPDAGPKNAVGASPRMKRGGGGEPVVESFRRDVDRVMRGFETHLGPPGLDIEVQGTTRAGPSSSRVGEARASAMLYARGRCRITLYRSGSALTAGERVGLAAHEAFHCYQFAWTANRPLPMWVQEGTAEWAAATVTAELGRGDREFFADWLLTYVQTLDRPLFQRTYDAHGWLAHAAQSGIGMWSRLRPMVESVSNEAAYEIVAGSASRGFFARWPSSETYHPPFGDAWLISGPGIPVLNHERRFRNVPVGNGTATSIEAPAYAANGRSLSLDAEIITVGMSGSAAGTERIGDGDRDLAELSGDWCTRADGRCTCPPGTAREGHTFERLRGGPSVWTVTGGSQAASVNLRGQTLRDACGASCLVGTWVQDAPPAGFANFQTVSGGTGAVLIIREDGALALDYTPMRPWIATVAGDTTGLTYTVEITGAWTGRVDLSGADGDTVQVRDTDFSLVSPRATATLGGQPVLTLGPADLRPLITGTELYRLSDCRGSHVTLSNSGITYQFARQR